MDLSDSDKAFLLNIARKVIESKANDIAPEKVISGSEVLKEKAGVFVSLHSSGALRGCIGYIQPEMSLIDGVKRSAENAAFEDSRFPPVSKEEVEEIEIEISLLTPPVSVESYKQIQLGSHGVILEKNGAKALFLPQVATEQGWDLPTTLSHLSKKAGLTPDGWMEGASFSVFETIVFSEKSL